MARLGFSNLLTQSYDYQVWYYASPNSLQRPTWIRLDTISGFEIEFEPLNYWWVLLSSSYHDSFFSNSCPPRLAVPTQITGSIGETFSLAMMRHNPWDAQNIQHLSPTPSSKMADYSMDVKINGIYESAIVEAKAANRALSKPDKRTVVEAWTQIYETNKQVNAKNGFVVITSYPSNLIFIVKVI